MLDKPWIFFAFLSALFAALVAIFGKIGIKGIDSTLATTVRAVIMATFLVIVSLVMGKGSLLSTINNKALLFIILAGLAGALSWLAYFYALKVGPVSGVAVLDRFSVVLVVLMAAIFLGEVLTWKTIIGIILVSSGLIFFVI